MARKCFFIHIPKCAGLSVAAAAEKVGCIHEGHATALEYHERYGREFSAGFKFAVVRHPADRCLSAYSYLMQQTPDHPYWVEDADQRSWLERFWTFEDIIMKGSRDMLSLLLFVPQMVWLRGCVLDCLLRYETLADDWRFLQSRFGFDDLPVINQSVHESWREVFTEAMLNRLRELYEEDFRTFGYE